MKRLALILPIVVLLSGCGSRAVSEKPAATALAGTYTAKLEDGRISSLTLSLNGNVAGSVVPVCRMDTDRIDYNDIQSTWSLIDPSMTPSGSWCVEFEGWFLRIYTDGTNLSLHYPYDVLNHKTAIYTRQVLLLEHR